MQDVNGTIESIEVKDFMCHRNQKWEFSPQMTFITGPNGSGKSAILTALQVGCRGDPSDAARLRLVFAPM